MRTRKIRVRPCNPTVRKQRPNLRFYVGYWEGNTKKHKFFETKPAADSFAAFKKAELARYGSEHAERLAPFGKTIIDAVNHYVAYLEANERSCTAVKLVDELIATKRADGASEHHLRDIRSRLGALDESRKRRRKDRGSGPFATHFGDRMVATITSKEIDDWLRSLTVAPLTRNHYRGLAILAFNYAVRCGYATTNPAAGAAKGKVIWKPPGILKVSEAARLLEAATPDVLPCIAIGLFAGLRRAEIERLTWSEINFESELIEVKAEKAKTGARRLVKIQPNLLEWLQPYAQLSGNVTPESCFRQMLEEARKAAGIKQWPKNALRHSYASYHLAQFQNAAVTALELGHTNASITFKHYRELVLPAEAARYWELKPSASASEKVVQMTAPRPECPAKGCGRGA